MFRIVIRAGSVAVVAAAVSAAGGGCGSHDGTGRPADTGAKAESRAGTSMVKEAETMKGHGQQLKAQGDETGGQQLIDQAKIKKAQGEELVKDAATQPAK